MCVCVFVCIYIHTHTHIDTHTHTHAHAHAHNQEIKVCKPCVCVSFSVELPVIPILGQNPNTTFLQLISINAETHHRAHFNFITFAPDKRLKKTVKNVISPLLIIS